MKGWKKSVVTAGGGGLIAAGFVMLVVPGPGLLTIAGGLALLATEYDWADRLLTRVKRRLSSKAEPKDPEK